MKDVHALTSTSAAEAGLIAATSMGPHTGSFSIREWCRYRGICPATFYNRRRHGEMPDTLQIGRRRIITAEADREWRLRMEQRAASSSVTPQRLSSA